MSIWDDVRGQQTGSAVFRVGRTWCYRIQYEHGHSEFPICGGPRSPLCRRPGFDRWRFAWTRAKHFRRAAELYGSQAEQRCRYLADMPLDDPGQDIASAHDYECAYYEAAERADWGTRS